MGFNDLMIYLQKIYVLIEFKPLIANLMVNFKEIDFLIKLGI